jgi:hypothetical protein
MTSAPSPRPVSALRARMIEDMTVRGCSEETRSNYIRDVRAFAAFIRRPPNTATAEDLVLQGDALVDQLLARDDQRSQSVRL